MTSENNRRFGACLFLASFMLPWYSAAANPAAEPLMVELRLGRDKLPPARRLEFLQKARANYLKSPHDENAAWAYLNAESGQNGVEAGNKLARELLKVKPELATVHFYLVRLNELDMDEKEIRREMDTAIRIAPNFETAYSERAFLRRGNDDQKGCLEDLQTAMKLLPPDSPEHKRLFDECIKTRITMKDNAGALKMCRDFLLKHPENDDVREEAARCLTTLKDWPGIIELYRDYKPNVVKSDFRLERGRAYFNMGKDSEALKELDQYIAFFGSPKYALQKPREVTAALVLRAKIYRKLGKLAAAAADEKRANSDIYNQTIFRF